MTRLGLPQVVVYPLVSVAAMVAAAILLRDRVPPWGMWLIQGILASVLIWALSFFRDPARVCPSEPHLILAPADGTITDVAIIDETGFIHGPALRIGIFLSIFSVHINRSPCRVRVERIAYTPGLYKNAMNPESSRVNESNALYLARLDDPQGRLIVRQISGAIARRIVCTADPGKGLCPGEKLGMIKFGSRTELYVQAHPDLACLVKVGDKVRAGLTVVANYGVCQG